MQNLCTANEDKIVPKSEIEILNQEIDDEEGDYRIRAGERVHYLEIMGSSFERLTMRRPHLLIPELPDFPDTDWVSMQISRAPNGFLNVTFPQKALPGIIDEWHPIKVEVNTLSKAEDDFIRPGVRKVHFDGRVAILKYAVWEWEIPRRANETRVYQYLEEYHQKLGGRRIAPKFLGHVTEAGRIMGFLLEMVEGESATPQDLPQCEQLLRSVYLAGVVHGDTNKFNFLVDRKNGQAKVLDFENASDWSEGKARAELISLANELAEEGYRGGVQTTIT